MDAIYTTDEYPRRGCQATIDVLKDGYVLRIYSPCGTIMESYAPVETPRAIARLLEEWASGFVPRIKGRLDYSPASPFDKSSKS